MDPSILAPADEVWDRAVAPGEVKGCLVGLVGVEGRLVALLRVEMGFVEVQRRAVALVGVQRRAGRRGVMGCSDLQAVGYLQVMTGEWAGISLGILRSDWSVLSLKGSRGSEWTLKGYERTLRGCETTLLRGFVCVRTAWTRGRVTTRPSYYRFTRVENHPQHSRQKTY